MAGAAHESGPDPALCASLPWKEFALSVSFDHAADIYDQTRGYPPDVQERIGHALLDAAGATHTPRILEMGVGTGRIALPIIRAGYRYTGVDISPRMLEKLRAALRTIPGAEQRVTLVEGDITALPFVDRKLRRGRDRARLAPRRGPCTGHWRGCAGPGAAGCRAQRPGRSCRR